MPNRVMPDWAYNLYPKVQDALRGLNALMVTPTHSTGISPADLMMGMSPLGTVRDMESLYNKGIPKLPPTLQRAFDNTLPENSGAMAGMTAAGIGLMMSPLLMGRSGGVHPMLKAPTMAEFEAAAPSAFRQQAGGLLDVPVDDYRLPAMLQKQAGSVGSYGKPSNYIENDVFGNGSRIEYVFPEKNKAIVRQVYPSGKIVYQPADHGQFGLTNIGKDYNSFDEALNAFKGKAISESLKARNQDLYGRIPKHWDKDARKVAKSIIDKGIDINRFSGSTQSRSKYIELENGIKIRMSDHDLPPRYESSDIDFRYGGDIENLLKQITGG